MKIPIVSLEVESQIPDENTHTEMLFVWRRYLAEKPEAERFEMRLRPWVWGSHNFRARGGMYVPNEHIEKLFDIWSKQIDRFLLRMKGKTAWL